MINIYNRIPIKCRIRIRSLVQHTGLLVSLWISLISLVFTGCGDKAVLYEIADETAEAKVSDSESASEEEEFVVPQDEPVTEDEGQMLIVFLCGAVNNPGVYELGTDSRIIDGINQAGGFREDASIDALNLAMEVTDGSRIYVPTVDEVESVTEDHDKDNVRPDLSNTYISNAGSISGGTGQDLSEGKININTADETLLTSLSGIGPNRAKAIIAYREEHGGFNTIEDLMNVSGIGQASFDKLKDDITV